MKFELFCATYSFIETRFEADQEKLVYLNKDVSKVKWPFGWWCWYGCALDKRGIRSKSVN